MKKLNVFITCVCMLFLTAAASAQSKTADYFAGKWSVLLKGTPNGDAKMTFILEKKDTLLTGVIQDSTGTEISKITSIEQKENAITIYFTAQSYDVNLALTKKDDDHATGSLLGMFDAIAERIKEIKK